MIYWLYLRTKSIAVNTTSEVDPMAEPITSTSHTPDNEQASTSIELIHDLQTPLTAVDEANPAAPNNSDAPASPVEPVKPAGQPALPGEDELDELIIEDFTIDGICGVY